MTFPLMVVVSVGLALLVGLLPAWIVQWRDDRRLIRRGRIATLSCGGYILKRTAKGAAVSPPKPASAGRRDEHLFHLGQPWVLVCVRWQRECDVCPMLHAQRQALAVETHDLGEGHVLTTP